MSLLTLSLFSCEDRFFPDVSDIPLENELVVEGFITNQDRPHQIRLSRSVEVALDSIFEDVPAETGALVQVIDQDGNAHTLTETDPGIYLTNQATFRAQLGNAYQLRIELADGEAYESDFQEFLPVAPFDSIWYQLSTDERVQAGVFRNIDVVRFFTNYETHNEPAYYRYEFEGTYAFASELQGNPLCWRRPEDIPPDLNALTLCYLVDTVNLPLNVTEYPDPVDGATGFEEMFNTLFDLRFRLGFSLLAKRYALTQDYHDYLSDVREQRDFGGSIFDSPPTQVIGNIRSLSDPDRFALGYFSTQSLITKRVFVPALGYELLPGRCAFSPGSPPPNDIPKFLDCCDCRTIEGSFTERPEYWN